MGWSYFRRMKFVSEEKAIRKKRGYEQQLGVKTDSLPV